MENTAKPYQIKQYPDGLIYVGILILAVTGILAYYIISKDWTPKISTLLIICASCAVLTIAAVISWKKSEKAWMTIDENGIDCSQWHSIVPWSRIDYCTFEYNKTGTYKRMYIHIDFIVHMKDGSFRRVDMLPLSYSEKNMIKAINTFCGRTVIERKTQALSMVKLITKIFLPLIIWLLGLMLYSYFKYGSL